MIELIRETDVAYTNLEVLLHDYEGYPSATSGGTWMRAEPQMAEELVWAGFDMVSLANNHTMDYGVGGLQATIDALDNPGLEGGARVWRSPSMGGQSSSTSPSFQKPMGRRCSTVLRRMEGSLRVRSSAACGGSMYVFCWFEHSARAKQPERSDLLGRRTRSSVIPSRPCLALSTRQTLRTAPLPSGGSSELRVELLGVGDLGVEDRKVDHLDRDDGSLEDGAEHLADVEGNEEGEGI